MKIIDKLICKAQTEQELNKIKNTISKMIIQKNIELTTLIELENKVYQKQLKLNETKEPE